MKECFQTKEDMQRDEIIRKLEGINIKMSKGHRLKDIRPPYFSIVMGKQLEQK
ncbi:hypothetical protein J2736_006777 [Paenibacillus qinlingensis]|uniref:Uncharacterized protein n=1 Tax=Paenibacillus qinlingensis TaxID=1837343 RepID=A0ABU1P6X3_9BACL|nr:hypothetical protein [Paenibacillus qinlingensis]